MKLDDERFTTELTKEVIQNNVLVSFKFQTSLDVKKALKKLCTEQSLSDWAGNPDIEDEMIRKYGAKVINQTVKIMDAGVVKVTLAFPMNNIEDDIVVMLNALGGDTYNIGLFEGIRIENFWLPDFFYKKYAGPKNGVDGIRKKLKVYDRPIFCGPVKPCIGLNPKQFADIGKQALLGGADIIKDDELIVNPPYNPFSERVTECMQAVDKAMQKTGENKMYIADISSGRDRIEELIDIGMNVDVDGFMVSPAIQGYDIINELTKKVKDKIIFAHNALMYAAAKNPIHGLKYSVFSKIQRMCGADVIVNPCPWGSFEVMSLEEHKDNMRTGIEDLYNYKKTFMAVCGAQSPSTIPINYRMANSKDFMMIVGGALYGHPNGAEAGARSLRQGWKAVEKGIKLEKYAKTHNELQKSIDAFGVVKY
jgi:ribulose-bisphosphate carboxylase large chain